MTIDAGGVRMKEKHYSFETSYPNSARWVKSHGWIEIGWDSWSNSFVRALNEGGMVWEGKPEYGTLDKALQSLERGLAKFMHAHGLTSP